MNTKKKLNTIGFTAKEGKFIASYLTARNIEELTPAVTQQLADLMDMDIGLLITPDGRLALMKIG